jgi:sugar/nucleoside kinase (ribokinase family)
VSHVAVVGNLARDRVDGGPPQPGGCPFFAAYALRAIEGSGHIVTRYAEADRALFEGPVASLGVPVTILRAKHTSGFDHAYAGETRSTTVTEIGDSWTPDDAEHVDRGVTWVHVGPLLRSDFPPDAIAALARGGRRVSLDAQGLVRAPRLGPLVQDAGFDPRLLDSVSVLKLSEEEASIVAGGRFDASSARALGVDEILVTLGSHGEDVWVDGVVTHVPTTPVLGVETTGAGDAFMVAYVSARHDGASPVDAARAGSALVAEMLTARRRGS